MTETEIRVNAHIAALKASWEFAQQGWMAAAGEVAVLQARLEALEKDKAKDTQNGPSL